jgi:hypothetical protein
MLGILATLFTYECACCHRRMTQSRYLEGAFYCLECARGEHRHGGWGSQAA